MPNRVVIEVGARRVTVYHGDDGAAPGDGGRRARRHADALGRFFVDGAVDVPNDDGPYGAFQVSVSGFSEVLASFGGGVGQIAMHGTNRPELLGQAVSNGCVRMANDTVTRVVQLATLGTPVTIVPSFPGRSRRLALSPRRRERARRVRGQDLPRAEAGLAGEGPSGGLARQVDHRADVAGRPEAGRPPRWGSRPAARGDRRGGAEGR